MSYSDTLQPTLNYTLTYTYDTSGNAVGIDDTRGPSYDRSFVWEGRRLISQTMGSTSIAYTYNHNGIRDSKTVGSVTTTYYLDGSLVLYETDGTDHIYYAYDVDGTPISMRYNGVEYFYMFDALGNVSYLVDSSGYTVVEYRYDAFGNITHQTSSMVADANPYRYRGYRYDQESGLYYLQSRYYDPLMGRFINADGMLRASDTVLGHNMFSYTENNPVMNIDPGGKQYCLMIMVDNGNSSPSCVGGGRGSSPLTNFKSELNKIDRYLNILSRILSLIDTGKYDQAFALFSSIIPSYMIHDSTGTKVIGLYFTAGGIATIGSFIIPIGGTFGIQLVTDENGYFGFQTFIGIGVHSPHVEFGAYVMYFPTMSTYKDLKGLSFQLNVSANTGLIGELTANGYYGYGFSRTLGSIDMGLFGSVSLEFQYTFID